MRSSRLCGTVSVAAIPLESRIRGAAAASGPGRELHVALAGPLLEIEGDAVGGEVKRRVRAAAARPALVRGPHGRRAPLPLAVGPLQAVRHPSRAAHDSLIARRGFRQTTAR